jgi:hypothetical protein
MTEDTRMGWVEEALKGTGLRLHTVSLHTFLSFRLYDKSNNIVVHGFVYDHGSSTLDMSNKASHIVMYHEREKTFRLKNERETQFAIKSIAKGITFESTEDLLSKLKTADETNQSKLLAFFMLTHQRLGNNCIYYGLDHMKLSSYFIDNYSDFMAFE